MYFCLLVIFFPSPNEGRIRESLSAWSEVHETNETETKWKSRNRRRTTLARMGKAGTRPQGSSYVAGSQTCACLSARGILGILHPPFMTLHTFRLYVASFHFICNFFFGAGCNRGFGSQAAGKLLQSKKKSGCA